MRTGALVALGAVVAVLLGGAPAAGVAAIEQPVSPPALKAAFLYNFAKFVEWPGEPPAAPLSLCVADDPAVADALEQLIGGRPISGHDALVVRSIATRGIRACHVAYLGGDDFTRLARAIDETIAKPVLTVGDGEQFVKMGGIVGLYVEDGRMRFAIGVDSAQRSGLRLSSRLLGLAKMMKDERHGQS